MKKHLEWRGMGALAVAALLLTAWAGGEVFGQVAFPPGGGGGIGIPAPPPAPAVGGVDMQFQSAVLHSAYLRNAGDIQWVMARLAMRLATQAARIAAMPDGPELADRACVGDDPLFDVGWSELRYRKVTAAQLDVGGYRIEARAGIEGEMSEGLYGGLTLKNARTRIRGANGWEMAGSGAEGYLSYALADWVTAGLFASGIQLDVEDINDNGAQLAVGGSLSGLHRFGATDVTLTTAMAKAFEDVTYREYDTVFCALLRVSRNWRSWLSASVHLFFSDSLRDSLPRDRSYFRAGADIVLHPHERLSFRVGYDCTLALADAEEQRIETGMAWLW